MKSLLSQPIVEQIYAVTKQHVAGQRQRGIEPHLAIVQIGADAASTKYVELKMKRAKELGILTSHYLIGEQEPFNEILQSVRFLASDEETQAIILQLPLPDRFASLELEQLLQEIPLEKDVDGLRSAWVSQISSHSPYTLSALLTQKSLLIPPMVSGVLSLLDFYKIPLEGQRIVIVGDGRLVGQPLFQYLQGLGCPVETVNEDTDHIFDTTRQADILISGTGVPNLVTYQWVKEGVVVVNCAQDVHEDSVSQVAAALSPAIGGVGPLTVAWLLYNVVLATERRIDE